MNGSATRHLSLVTLPPPVVHSSIVPANPDCRAEQPRANDWQALVRRTAAGEQAALAELYDRSCHLVFGLTLRILGDPTAAEDAVVEVYAQAWRDAKKFDDRRGTPAAWLLTLARSRAIDTLRRRRREQAADPLESADDVASAMPNPEEVASTVERERRVRNALDHLSVEQRQAVELVYFAGLSHGEIARQLGLPLGSIKTRIRLAMLHLREMLGHLTPPATASKDVLP